MSKYVSKDNAERVLSEYAGVIKDKVDKVEGKGLSTNDFTDTAAGKLNGIETGAEVNVLEGVQVDGTDLTISNKKVNVVISGKADKVVNAASGNLAGLDSNGNLTDSGYKATNQVTSDSSDLVTSGAVKEAIDTAVSSAYHAAGTKTVAELTSSLLIAANEGNVYNMTDSGTTTADFIEGQGKPINEGDNVGIAKVGSAYKFDLLSGFVDLSNYVQKSSTAGLIKNDGTIDTNSYALNNAVIKGVQVDGTDLTKDANGKVNINNKATRPSASTAGDIATLTANGDLADGGFSFDKDGQTATGNPLSFTTDSAQVASDCKITLEPIQAGSGDPSPSNVRAISGYDKVELTGCGKNLCDGVVLGVYDSDGSLVESSLRARTKIILLKAGTYAYSCSTSASGKTLNAAYIYWTNGTYGNNSRTYDSGWISAAGIFTLTADTYVSISLKYADESAITISDLSIQLELGSTATTYEPYNPVTDITLNLPETVYGGTLDVETGELVVDREIVDLGSLNWVYNGAEGLFYADITDVKQVSSDSEAFNGISTVASIIPAGSRSFVTYPVFFIFLNNYRMYTKNFTGTDATEFKNSMSGKYLVYELATPYTIYLTPAQVNLLKGTNTVTTNGTTINLTYRNGEVASLEDVYDIEKKLDPTEISVKGNPISIKTKSAQLAKNAEIVLEPIQAGSGDPSPSNVRPISGYDEVDIVSCWKNLFSKDSLSIDGGIDDSGTIISGSFSNTNYTFVYMCAPNTTYTISKLVGNRFRAIYTTEFPDIGVQGFRYIKNDNGTSITITTGNDAKYLVVWVWNSSGSQTKDEILASVQLELGSTATTYEPYNPATDITLNLPETVYGGTLDVETGELRVEWAKKKINDITWSTLSGTTDSFYCTNINAKKYETNVKGNIKCSVFKTVAQGITAANCISGLSWGEGVVCWYTGYTSSSAFKTAYGDQEIVYELATPYTLKLTPHQIRLLAGKSVITTNGTTIHLEYSKSDVASIEAVDSVGESINALSDVVADNIEALQFVTSNALVNITSRLSDLPVAIAEQNLEKYGYKIGDYFVGASGYKYWLADLDTFYGGYNSYATVNVHHVGIVVNTRADSKWNETDDISNVNYKDSTLHTFLSTTAFNNIKSDLTALFGNWESHLVEHHKLYNKLGGWAWIGSEYIAALTECQIYGCPIWSADKYQQGEGARQLELFRRHSWMRVFGDVSIWLRSISTGGCCDVSSGGSARIDPASRSYQAAGLILFK